jgi:hypothetical protein
MVQLAGRERRRRLDLGMVGEALAGKGISAKQPPSPFDEIEPAGADGKRFLMQPGIGGKPLADRPPGVTGEVVIDQVELTDRAGKEQQCERDQETEYSE